MVKRFNAIVAMTMMVGSLLSPAAYSAPDGPAQDLMLVLDNSGSMHKLDPHFALRGAIERFLGAGDSEQNIGIVVFDQNATLATPLAGHASLTPEALHVSLDQINYRGRYTNTAEAIDRSIDELKAHGRGEAERAIIILTDGVIDTGDTTRNGTSARWLRDELATDAAKNGIRIYTIALGARTDDQLLQQIASTTQGGYFRAARVEDLDQAFGGITSALQAAVEPPPAQPEPVAAVEPPVAGTEAQPVAATISPEPAAVSAPRQDSLPASAGGLATRSTVAGADEAVVAATPPSSWWDTPLAPEQLPYYGIFAALVLGSALFAALRLRRTPAPAEEPRYAQTVPYPTAKPKEIIPDAYLQDLGGVLAKENFPLNKAWTLIGRQHLQTDRDVDELIIANSTIGRQHAAIQYRDHGFWLHDRRSRNGTYVNGTRITDAVCLKHGDVIRFHDFEFRFMLGCLADSDETVVASNLEQWVKRNRNLDDTNSTLGYARRMVSDPPHSDIERAEAAAAKPVPAKETTFKPPEDANALDDITLPSDDAVKKALDKYFEASNF